MSRVLITGSSSYLARHLRPMLAGHEVREVDLLIGGDVTDPATWQQQRNFDPEVIFHLAGIRPMQALHEVDLALSVNVLSTALGLDFIASQRHPAVFVLASSYFASGSGVYGLTKRCAELLGSRQPSFRALRLGSVVSLDKPSGFSDFYRRLAADGGPVELPVPADMALPVIHPEDAASALLHLAVAPSEKLTRAVYGACGAMLSARQVMEAMYPPPEVVCRPEVGERALSGADPYLDATPLLQETNWRPSHDAGRLIAELLAAKSA